MPVSPVSQLKLLIILLVTTVLMPSCIEQEPVVAQDIIPPDSMVLVLRDMHIAEAYLNNKRTTTHPDSLTSLPLYRGIFEKYNIPEAYFRKSFEYYTANPKLLKDIYDKVLEALSTMQAEHEGAKPLTEN